MGEPLTNWRFAPVAEKLRFTISSPWHGSIPASLNWGFSRSKVGSFEHGLDRADIGSGTDQGFVGPLAEKQLQRADNDRFARARLSGDGGESRTELPFQVLDQRQVLDSQQCQNGGHGEEVES